MIWIILFILLIVVAAISQGDSNIKNFEKQTNFKTSDLIPSGTYVSGHIDLNDPLDKTSLLLNNDEIQIFQFTASGYVMKAKIPKVKITNALMEDSSTIQSRVGIKRLLLTGIFAFAWKKKVKLESAYIVIEWKYNNFDQETIFEFEGSNSIQKANTLRNKIINYLSTHFTKVDIPTSEVDKYLYLIENNRKIEAVNLYKANNKTTLEQAIKYIEELK